MLLIKTFSQCSAFFNYKQYSMHKIMIKVYITFKTVACSNSCETIVKRHRKRLYS